MRARQESCCFTGHRPTKLPWRYNETDSRCVALKQRIRDAAELAYEQGYRHFICGMAQGCDLYFAEAVLLLRQKRMEIRLVAMLPHPGQTKNWPEEDRKRHQFLCEQADSCEMLSPAYAPDCMQKRNRAMVERAQVLISVYDGSPSGTGSTVRYAEKLGRVILPVWI